MKLLLYPYRFQRIGLPKQEQRSCQSDVNRSPLAKPPPCPHSTGHEVLPLGQSGLAAKLVSLTVDEVAFLIKVIVNRAIHRGEFLQ